MMVRTAALPPPAPPLDAACLAMADRSAGDGSPHFLPVSTSDALTRDVDIIYFRSSLSYHIISTR